MQLFSILLILFQCYDVKSFDYSLALFRILTYYGNEVLEHTGNNKTECRKQLKLLSADINEDQFWAIQMVDASGRPQYGILEGNIYFIGSYDECLTINVVRNTTNIKGQYCRASISPTDLSRDCVKNRLETQGVYGLGKTSLEDIEELASGKWDVCLPAACKANDLQKLWDFAENRYQIQFHLTFDDYYCDSVKKQSHYTTLQIASISVFGVFGLLVLLSTLYDVLVFQKRKVKNLNVLMAFSFYTNGKLLFSKLSKNDQKMSCLNGLKSISLLWIILSHRFIFTIGMGIAVNELYVFDWLKHDGNMFIVGAPALVDTFFIISGLLISYTVLFAAENGVKIPWLVFILHRLIRLTPGLGAILLFHMGVISRVGSGPFWFYVEEYLSKPCTDKWWSVLLYIQNYAYPDSLCMPQSWYISTDTQLYILSPFLLIPLKKWPKHAFTVIGGLMIFSVVYVICLTYKYNLQPNNLDSLLNFYEYIYIPTHARMLPWLAGLVLGYCLFRNRNETIIMQKWLVLLLWTVSIILMLLSLYSYMAFVIYQFSSILIALVVGLNRAIWTVAVCWIVFACCTGYGGYINTFLSWPIFIPISRISYSLYLTHFCILAALQARTKIVIYLDNFSVILGYWGDLLLAISFAIVWSLTFESPVIIIEKIIFRRRDNQNKNASEANGK